MSFFHKRKIHFPSFFLPDIKFTGKDHRGICMGIDRHDPLMDRFGFCETAGILDMVSE